MLIGVGYSIALVRVLGFRRFVRFLDLESLGAVRFFGFFVCLVFVRWLGFKVSFRFLCFGASWVVVLDGFVVFFYSFRVKTYVRSIYCVLGIEVAAGMASFIVFVFRS